MSPKLTSPASSRSCARFSATSAKGCAGVAAIRGGSLLPVTVTGTSARVPSAVAAAKTSVTCRPSASDWTATASLSSR